MDSKICWFEVIHSNHFVVKGLPLNSTLSNLQHCDCEKEFSETKKVNLKSSIPVIKATTCPRSAGCNFAALSFLVNGQYFKDHHKILRTLGLDHISFTHWIHIVEWIAPFVKRIANWSVQKSKN